MLELRILDILYFLIFFIFYAVVRGLNGIWLPAAVHNHKTEISGERKGFY